MDPAFKRRAFFVCLALVAGLSALSVRLISLQVWDRKLSSRSAIPRMKSEDIIPARRGLIVDRNQTVIAQNRPEADLVADLTHLRTTSILVRAVTHYHASQMGGWKNLNKAERKVILANTREQYVNDLSDEEIIKQHLDYATAIIGRELRIQPSELEEKVRRGGSRVVVQKGIKEDLARRLEKALHERRIQGFRFERSESRYYPMPTLAPHLIGFINHKGMGECGLEKSMHDILAGRDGKRELKREENGSVNLIEAAKVTPPKMGKHVRVTLDMGIQGIVEEELGMACEAYQAKKGSILVVDPRNGDILAMASRPHFNLNVRENYSTAGTSFAVSGQYESGSVMKIIGMSAALEEGVANRNTTVHCGWGKVERPGFTVTDEHHYGVLSFDNVLVKSSNTGVFQFSEKVGRVGFYEYLDAFGFGQRTDFPIHGEARGRIADRSNQRNFASATYGYGVSVSPLQLAMAYSVLANGGTLLKPRLIDSIVANNGVELHKTPVTEVGRVLSENTARQMCLALEKVVQKGTGRRAQVPGYRAGGKTGTAEKWSNKLGAYDKERKYLTFAGIVPIQDPRFVCIVTIDEPTGMNDDFQIGGGSIAAPVFAQVSGRVARYLNLTPTEELPIVLTPNE